MRSAAVFITLLLLISVAAFAQAPQNQAGSQDQVGKGTTGTIPDFGSPSTFSEASNLSGCLVHGNGRFWLAGSGNAGIYALESGDLSHYVHHVVRVSGYPLARPSESDHRMAFHVQSVADTGELCSPEANEQLPAIAVTGNAGNEGDVIPETSTHVNQETAGVETQAGMAQARGKSARIAGQPLNERPGYPPNWEQVGESRGAAADLAASAEQTEVGAPQGTYGVGSRRPNYQNPSATQEIGGAQSPIQQSANTSGATQVGPNSPPNKMQGCVSQVNGQWQLTSGGKNYRLQGNTVNLKGWNGHTVAVTGRVANGRTFQVSGVQDVSPNCESK
jgi:hypothetical protein